MPTMHINPQPCEPPARNRWAELYDFLSDQADDDQWYDFPVETEAVAKSARSAVYAWRNKQPNGASTGTSIVPDDDGRYLFKFVRREGRDRGPDPDTPHR